MIVVGRAMNGLLGAREIEKKDQWEIKKCFKENSKENMGSVAGQPGVRREVEKNRCKHIEASENTGWKKAGCLAA